MNGGERTEIRSKIKKIWKSKGPADHHARVEANWHCLGEQKSAHIQARGGLGNTSQAGFEMPSVSPSPGMYTFA